jgi:5-methylcytosine-specific restriction enzyme subunit McrC
VREVDVVEYGQVRHLALEPNQRDAILACGGDLTLAPEPGTDSLWCLRAGSYVGTVSLPGMILRIRPKLSIARLFAMISAAAGAIQWDERCVGLAQSSAVEDVLAAALVDSIRRGLATGLLRGYVTVEEESFVVRGRLDVTETLRRRPVTLAPLVQTPEFLEEDTPENRVLATALSHLAKRVSSPVVRSRVVDCQRAFAGVQCLPSGSPLPRLQRHRLNARWWGALELAMLVLNACGLDLPSGQHLSRSFLIDMNVVFERFVHRALADELRPWGHDLQHNRSGLYLDEDQCHGLRPDLSVWANAKCRFAGDCKYKYTDDGNARRDDVYQSLAYAAATGLPRITLIYGGGPLPARDVEIVGGRPTIRVRVLNLAASKDQLQAQFAGIALEIAHDL